MKKEGTEKLIKILHWAAFLWVVAIILGVLGEFFPFIGGALILLGAFFGPVYLRRKFTDKKSIWPWVDE